MPIPLYLLICSTVFSIGMISGIGEDAFPRAT